MDHYCSFYGLLVIVAGLLVVLWIVGFVAGLLFCFCGLLLFCGCFFFFFSCGLLCVWLLRVDLFVFFFSCGLLAAVCGFVFLFFPLFWDVFFVFVLFCVGLLRLLLEYWFCWWSIAFRWIIVFFPGWLVCWRIILFFCWILVFVAGPLAFFLLPWSTGFFAGLLFFFCWIIVVVCAFVDFVWIIVYVAVFFSTELMDCWWMIWFML